MEFKIFEVIEKCLVERASRTQVFDILIGKFQVVHRIDKLFKTGHDGIAAAIGYPAEEHIKDRYFVLVALIEVSGRHCQFIEIGHRGQVAFDIQHSKQLPPCRLLCEAQDHIYFYPPAADWGTKSVFAVIAVSCAADGEQHCHHPQEDTDSRGNHCENNNDLEVGA